MENNRYFSHQTLAAFVAAQGKKVNKVICHLWQNSINKDAPVELIDNLQLLFDDGSTLTISCNENGDALEVISFDYKTTAKELEQEFGDKIRVFAVNASSTKMWENVIGLNLLAVRLEREGEFHKAESLILDFGQERRLVAINPEDGLLIDYYED